MSESWTFSLGTILFGLFHLTALVLAFVFWRRCPKVCVLVLIGSLLNLLAAGARVVLPVFWFHLFEDHGSFAIMNLGISCVNIAGSTLYLVAIFIGRDPERSRRLPMPPRQDDDWPPPAARPRNVERGSTGIQE